jgi:hypothetical protein
LHATDDYVERLIEYAGRHSLEPFRGNGPNFCRSTSRPSSPTTLQIRRLPAAPFRPRPRLRIQRPPHALAPAPFCVFDASYGTLLRAS